MAHENMTEGLLELDSLSLLLARAEPNFGQRIVETETFLPGPCFVHRGFCRGFRKSV